MVKLSYQPQNLFALIETKNEFYQSTTYFNIINFLTGHIFNVVYVYLIFHIR